MGKFKVGDHVIILVFGRRGIIVKAEGFDLPKYYVHCIETDRGDWYTESELKLANNEKKGEKKQVRKRFKPGDMIVMNELADIKYHYLITKMGWVGSCSREEEDGFVVVKDVKSPQRHRVAADAVNPYVRPKRRVVIEITDDGAEAKYIVGKNIEKTASVKRYKDDKPDDRLAAHYVVGKLFGHTVTQMDALKNAKYDCMIARYHLDEISKVLDPFGEPDFGKVDSKF
jgi:hypothetical protein